MSTDNCVEKVDVFLEAKGLPKVSNSEPNAFAVLFLEDNKTYEFVRMQTTPIINDQPNPAWSTPITLDYIFEMRQNVVVKVYSRNGSLGVEDLSQHTFIGECKFTLASLLTSRDKNLTPSLTGAPLSQGSLLVRAEARTDTKDLFCVTFKGTKLINKDGFFSKSDPFLVISRLNEDGSYTVVWKSVKVDNSLDPAWEPVKIPMVTLCNGDLYRPLKIAIFDWEASGKHQPMGEVETSVQGMLSANGTGLEVIEPEKVGKKKGYTCSGLLSALDASVEQPAEGQGQGEGAAAKAQSAPYYSLTEYITHGCEISLIAAIDFTNSNGAPGDPVSLHFMGDPSTPNPYQSTIQAVGSVLAPYDYDQMYPVYGFGAQLPKADGKGFGTTSHCFPVSADGLEVHGIEGILQAYKECVPKLKFSGPTLFEPLIQAATTIAVNSKCCQEHQKYTILLIITDGVIHDLKATKAAIIEASTQPLSIIIVGVGSADFKAMDALDSDHELLTVGDKTAARDIVQFVAHTGQDYEELARGLLAEVPDQFKQFMESRGIRPNKRY